jgi:uncharacterized protein YecE (DUF72 family)
MPFRLSSGYPYHMARILVGTTSWTEASPVESGRFYPPEVHTAEERLRYYAHRFPVVEVDSSYYGLPSARNAGFWAERTPAGFVFDMNAFRIFTNIRPRRSPCPRTFATPCWCQLGIATEDLSEGASIPRPVRPRVGS